ncbi:hypothetical protein BDR04DRAFT_1106487, partial [Suillus decipiens]
MPPWAILSDLKLRIPVLRHVQGLSIKQICELYDKLADANSNSCKLGCWCSLNYKDINYIKSHCFLHSSVFLDELQSQLLLCRH